MYKLPDTMTPALIASGSTEHIIERKIIHKISRIKEFLETCKPEVGGAFFMPMNNCDIPTANEIIKQARKLVEQWLDQHQQNNESFPKVEKLYPQLTYIIAQGINEPTNELIDMHVQILDDEKYHKRLWHYTKQMYDMIAANIETSSYTFDIECYCKVLETCIKDLRKLGWTVRYTDRFPGLDDDYIFATIDIEPPA